MYIGYPEEEAAERMNEILDAEKPDLVIYTGDLIFAKPAAEGLDKALEPTISRHIPFAVTWGNHDDEQDMTRTELSEYVEKKDGCLLNTRTKGISGVSNFVLPVQASTGNTEAAVLYIFDSNTYSSLKQIKGYDWIKADQVEWYRKESAAFTARNGGKPLPAMAFFHIGHGFLPYPVPGIQPGCPERKCLADRNPQGKSLCTGHQYRSVCRHAECR